MCGRCHNSFLAALIVIFSFWMTSFSWWVILIAGLILFLKSVRNLVKEGCGGMCFSDCGTCNSEKTGAELFMEKGSEELHEGPSKKEVEQTLKKKKK